MENLLIDKDLLSIQKARRLAKEAKEAFRIFCNFSQEQVDTIVESMSKAGIEASEKLAQMAVEETGYGNVKDKIIKNLFSVKNIYDSIKNLKTVGVVNRDNVKKVIEIAHPMGVICAITPTTNPTSTVMFKALIAIKSRNAVIFSPHPGAAKCSCEASYVLARAAELAGAPKGLISCLDIVTMEGSKELMSHEDVSMILATGGLNMVKAAHSYGKPALGVGPGNTPVFVDKSANLEKASRDIIASKSFDYGVICASEQSVVAHSDIDRNFREILKKNGGYFLSPSEVEKASSLLIKNNAMNAQMVGKSPKVIADAAGFTVPDGTRLLVAPLDTVGPKYPLSREVLSSIIAYFTRNSWQECCELCIEIINFGGLGHTMVIHSTDEEVITQFALQKPVFRILINTSASQGAIGLTTPLTPSLTLSTGTWGGGISSDNISARHLLNIKRVAYETNPLFDETSAENPCSSSYSGISESDLENIVRNVIKNLNL
ncbi:MAG: aldehyde dehydrogenase family protein [Actinobacteria bacterium]|nr:aldehyde dehydrogenase family protein [Actinomycetota bacterium]